MGQVKSRNSNDGRHFFLQPNLYEYKFQFPVSGQGLFFCLFSFQQECLKYNPSSISCTYWKGVSHASKGNFYEAVKSSTKVWLSINSLFWYRRPHGRHQLITDFLDYKVWHFIHHCYFQLDSFKLVPLFTLEQKPKLHSFFVTSV